MREQIVTQEQTIANLNIEISSQAHLHDNSRQAADSEQSKMIATLETQKTALADKLEEQAALASEHREAIDRMEKELHQLESKFFLWFFWSKFKTFSDVLWYSTATWSRKRKSSWPGQRIGGKGILE